MTRAWGGRAQLWQRLLRLLYTKVLPVCRVVNLNARDARGRPRFRGFYFWYVSAFAPVQELHFSVLPAHSLALPRRAARAARLWSADRGPAPRAPHAVLNEAEALAGKRAALFFSAGWCPQCTNLVQLTLTLDTEHVPKRLLPSISTTAPPNPEPRHVEASRGSRAAGHTTALTCGHDSEAAFLCALRCAFAASRWAYSTFCQPRQERGGGRGRAGSRVDWRTVGGRLGKLGALRSAPFELPWP